MPENLQAILRRIQTTSTINPNGNPTISDIIKYSDSDEQTAYLLGILFKKNIASSILSEHSKRSIIQYVKAENLVDFFYHGRKPSVDKFRPLAIILFLVAVTFLIVGIIQTINSKSTVGVSSRYLTLVVRDGGTKLVFGCLLLAGSFLRYRFEKRKNLFFEEHFLQENNNI